MIDETLQRGDPEEDDDGKDKEEEQFLVDHSRTLRLEHPKLKRDASPTNPELNSRGNSTQNLGEIMTSGTPLEIRAVLDLEHTN